MEGGNYSTNKLGNEGFNVHLPFFSKSSFANSILIQSSRLYLRLVHNPFIAAQLPFGAATGIMIQNNAVHQLSHVCTVVRPHAGSKHADRDSHGRDSGSGGSSSRNLEEKKAAATAGCDVEGLEGLANVLQFLLDYYNEEEEALDDSMNSIIDDSCSSSTSSGDANRGDANCEASDGANNEMKAKPKKNRHVNFSPNANEETINVEDDCTDNSKCVEGQRESQEDSEEDNGDECGLTAIKNSAKSENSNKAVNSLQTSGEHQTTNIVSAAVKNERKKIHSNRLNGEKKKDAEVRETSKAVLRRGRSDGALYDFFQENAVRDDNTHHTTGNRTSRNRKGHLNHWGGNSSGRKSSNSSTLLQRGRAHSCIVEIEKESTHMRRSGSFSNLNSRLLFYLSNKENMPISNLIYESFISMPREAMQNSYRANSKDGTYSCGGASANTRLFANNHHYSNEDDRGNNAPQNYDKDIRTREDTYTSMSENYTNTNMSPLTMSSTVSPHLQDDNRSDTTTMMRKKELHQVPSLTLSSSGKTDRRTASPMRSNTEGSNLKGNRSVHSSMNRVESTKNGSDKGNPMNYITKSDNSSYPYEDYSNSSLLPGTETCESSVVSEKDSCAFSKVTDEKKRSNSSDSITNRYESNTDLENSRSNDSNNNSHHNVEDKEGHSPIPKSSSAEKSWGENVRNKYDLSNLFKSVSRRGSSIFYPPDANLNIKAQLRRSSAEATKQAKESLVQLAKKGDLSGWLFLLVWERHFICIVLRELSTIQGRLSWCAMYWSWAQEHPYQATFHRALGHISFWRDAYQRGLFLMRMETRYLCIDRMRRLKSLFRLIVSTIGALYTVLFKLNSVVTQVYRHCELLTSQEAVAAAVVTAAEPTAVTYNAYSTAADSTSQSTAGSPLKATHAPGAPPDSPSSAMPTSHSARETNLRNSSSPSFANVKVDPLQELCEAIVLAARQTTALLHVCDAFEPVESGTSAIGPGGRPTPQMTQTMWQLWMDSTQDLETNQSVFGGPNFGEQPGFLPTGVFQQGGAFPTTMSSPTLMNYGLSSNLVFSSTAPRETSPRAAGPTASTASVGAPVEVTLSAGVQALLEAVQTAQTFRQQVDDQLEQGGYRPPLARFWQRILVATAITVPPMVWFYRKSPAEMAALFTSAAHTAKQLFHNYAYMPAQQIWESLWYVRPGVEDRRNSLQCDAESLANIIRDYHEDYYPAMSEANLDKIRDSTLEALVAGVAEDGGYGLVAKHYRDAVKYPVFSALFGNLPRILLIQMSYQSLEVSRVTNGIDEVLESNDLNFKVMSLVPVTVVTTAFCYWLRLRWRVAQSPIRNQMKLYWRMLHRIVSFAGNIAARLAASDDKSAFTAMNSRLGAAGGAGVPTSPQIFTPGTWVHPPSFSPQHGGYGYGYMMPRQTSQPLSSAADLEGMNNMSNNIKNNNNTTAAMSHNYSNNNTNIHASGMGANYNPLLLNPRTLDNYEKGMVLLLVHVMRTTSEKHLKHYIFYRELMEDLNDLENMHSGRDLRLEILHRMATTHYFFQ